MRKALIALAALVLSSTLAAGQSVPSNPAMTYGYVPTVGVWNSWFAAKQDALGFVPLNVAGGTMLGKLTAMPSTSQNAGFNIGQGVAPGAPLNGDMWLTPSGLYFQVGGSTVGPITATVGVGCAAMPALTGDITSMGGSCVTALATGAVAANLGAYVASFNGRSNAVTPQSGDYNTGQITTSNGASPPPSGAIGEVQLLSALEQTGTITFTNGTSNATASIALPAGTVVHWGSGAPTGFSNNTNYYVLGTYNSSPATSVQLSATPGGSAITPTSGGSVTFAQSTIQVTATPSVVVAIPLNAGEWDCDGTIANDPNSSTVVGNITGAISASAALTTVGLPGTASLNVSVTGLSSALALSRRRYRSSVNFLAYLVGQANFNTSTDFMFGSIKCVRVF